MCGLTIRLDDTVPRRMVLVPDRQHSHEEWGAWEIPVTAIFWGYKKLWFRPVDEAGGRRLRELYGYYEEWCRLQG